MREISDELYFLSQDELIVLLATKGIESVYLLNNGKVSLEEKDILYAVNHLFQSQLIEGNNDKFRICEPLNTMLTDLCNAGKLLILRKLEHDVESICVYQSETYCVVLHWDERRRNKVEISSQTMQDVEELFMEYTTFEKEYAPVLEEEDGIRQILEETHPVDNGELLRFHNVPLLFEMMDLETKKVKEKVIVQIKEKETIIVSKSSKNQEVEEYKEDTLQKRVEFLLEVNEE